MMRYAARQVDRWSITHAYAVVLALQGIPLLTPDPIFPNGTGYLSVTLGILSVTAGVLILAGLQWRDPLSALSIEKVGHIFGAAVWAVEIGIVWYLIGGPTLDNLTALAFMLASGIKARRLHKKSRSDVRRVKARIRMSKEDGES